MKHGDFTGLAESYELYRVGYSDDVLKAIAALLPARPDTASVLDVGAGTGKWSRHLVEYFGSCTAVEPNDDMRAQGEQANPTVKWHPGSAEETGQPSSSFDWVTMASSFHWTDYKVALAEFHRLLKPEGMFTCLWNPRIVKGVPLLEEVEATIDEIVPRKNRKSSGSSEFVETLCDKLMETGHFTDLIYIEARFNVRMTKEHYIGVWRSVNDIRVQAGPEKFEELMQRIEEIIAGEPHLDCPYLTRAWSVRRT